MAADEQPRRRAKGRGGRGRAPLPYLLAFLALQVVAYAFVLSVVRPDTEGERLRLDRFYGLLQRGQVSHVTLLDFDSRAIAVADGKKHWVELPRGELAVNNLATTLATSGVPTRIDQQVYKGILNFLAQFLLPVLLFFTLFGMLFLLFMSGTGAGGFALFGRTKARRYGSDDERVTFSDVAGVDEAIEELKEVKEFLKEPRRFAELGARPPKGVLLMGPPGCGKTLLARAVAGEAGVPFYSASGSEFVEMLVGVGAARVRDLFDQARAAAPAIVFIDEIDAVGRSRGAGLVAHEEREQTLNELLVQMDGFGPSSGVVVMTATNRPDILDEALTRPGRFDRHVVIDAPDVKGRRDILAVHLRDKPLADDLDVPSIARRTPGFSGADLAKVVNEAALLAARRGHTVIGRSEIDEGIDRVVSGSERRTRLLSDREKRIVAVHEAAHALVAWSLPHADPVEKVSVVARGMSLGHTRTVSEEDQFLLTRSQLRDRIAVLLAGRLAEIEVFGEPSNSAASDLQMATDLARQMVMDLGMSESLTPLVYSRENRKDDVDAAVAELVEEAAAAALLVLTRERPRLERLATTLSDRETLQRDELEAVLAEPVVDQPVPTLLPATGAAEA